MLRLSYHLCRFSREKCRKPPEIELFPVRGKKISLLCKAVSFRLYAAAVDIVEIGKLHKGMHRSAALCRSGFLIRLVHEKFRDFYLG